MITFIPFEMAHVSDLQLQDAQRYLRSVKNRPDLAPIMEQPDLTWTAMTGSSVIGCGGIIPKWTGRGVCWALVGAVPPTAWMVITRYVRGVLLRAQVSGFHRLETTVETNFSHGRRWARLLGFVPESLAEAYGPDGRDHIMYVRIRK